MTDEWVHFYSSKTCGGPDMVKRSIERCVFCDIDGRGKEDLLGLSKSIFFPIELSHNIDI
jgi:hypothetical protein